MPTVEDRLARTEAAIATLRERNEMLAQENRWLKDQIFGRSSEKRAAPVVGNQPYLFNEAEALGEATAEERVAVPAHSRAKRGRKPILDTLPRVDIVHDLAADEKLCPHDGTPLVRVGEETSEQTDYVPATLRVLRHIRYKYGCPCCKSFMKTAAKPEQVLPKSNAAPSLLAQVTTSKYVDGMPLYRQQAQFARLGLELPRATMANWIVKLGTVSVIPIINLLNEQMLDGPLIHCDETRVQVLKSDKAPTAEHWMWVRAGGLPGKNILLFDYDPSRGADVVRRLFADYEGILVSDGYGPYDKVTAEFGLVHGGCLVHARRYFDRARKKMPEAPERATAALDFFTRLYRIEKQLKARDPTPTPDEWLAVRREKSKPVMDAFKAWLDDIAPRLPPQGALGEAVNYTLGQWKKLTVFLDNPIVPPDNNRAENAIRPFVVGRKAWLFCHAQAGARASANLYSLAESAKANGVEPFAYFRHLYTHLPRASTVDDFDALLPWNAKTVIAQN